MRVSTIVRNTVRRGYTPVVLEKLYYRGRYANKDREAATAWAMKNSEDMGEWAEKLAPSLWQEALEAGARFSAEAGPRMSALNSAGVRLGGGASFELLYFLCRLRAPQYALETGVAAGWSTAALLSAMRENGIGLLYSSEFPYIRLQDPGKYVGYLVPDELKTAWTLYTEGDRKNLRRILRNDVRIGLAHYDSDKSWAGRERFLKWIGPHLESGAPVVVDDVGDNFQFRKAARASQEWHVFEYMRGFVGVIFFPAREGRNAVAG